MRIIAGEFGSRPLKTLSNDSTRPTLDKVKESIFSRLGPYFNGGIVLDLFSGSGAIGLECISRGMDKAVMIEKSNAAYNIIKENVRTLKAEGCLVWKMDYKIALNKVNDEGYKFDLIYIDPPYKLGYYNTALRFINEHEICKENCDIVVESLKEETFEAFEHLEVIKEVIYGISKITYMRWKA